jgi:Spy/CpxP family protein refolding chaperone
MNSNTGFAQTTRRRFFKRAAGIALLAGLAITAGVTAIAHNVDNGGWHHGGTMTAADINDHVDQMLARVYSEIDVTDAQKAKIDPLVKQAITDLTPLHDTAHAAHADLLALLNADTVDRAAIENVRAEHVRLADQASRRIAQLLGDVADVLTPAQRKALAAHIAQHHPQMQG